MKSESDEREKIRTFGVRSVEAKVIHYSVVIEVNLPTFGTLSSNQEAASLRCIYLRFSSIFSIAFRARSTSRQTDGFLMFTLPKVSKPNAIADYRPISVTPLLSRLAERLVVSNWLLPSVPPELIDDQFGFRPTGSTECALTYLTHHVASMLETATYVRCLMVDFSKAFDVVDHAILFKKLSSLSMPDVAINWFISFFSERKQYLKVGGKLSLQQNINSSIVQGSGVGPMCYVVMESDLRTLSLLSKLCKYADDTNLLVPSNTDTDLIAEFDNIKQWAINNCMSINLGNVVLLRQLLQKRLHPYRAQLQQLKGYWRTNEKSAIDLLWWI